MGIVLDVLVMFGKKLFLNGLEIWKFSIILGSLGGDVGGDGNGGSGI